MVASIQHRLENLIPESHVPVIAPLWHLFTILYIVLTN